MNTPEVAFEYDRAMELLAKLHINGGLVHAITTLHRFAFGDAPEWERANATFKHRVRELEAELAERDLDTATLAAIIRQVPGWEDFDGTPSSTVGVAAGLIRSGCG